MTDYLLKIGANPNVSDYERSTALHNTAIIGSLDICQQLILKGGTISAEGDSFTMPLHLAVGACQLSVIEFLQKNGAPKILDPILFGRTEHPYALLQR